MSDAPLPSGELPRKSKRPRDETRFTVHSTIFLFSIGFAVLAIGFAIWMRWLTGTALYDYNYSTFHETLTPEQGAAIIQTANAVVNTAIAPLILACIFLTAAGVLLWRDNQWK